ncbi:hypothetical protein, partial [Escherichia coli]|uniref:hypothetical protein n=1 Tax=Escherichia coli TaxID=562 RepID=UPI001BC8ADEB
TDFGGKTSIFSHPVYLFLREFSLQDFRGGSLCISCVRRSYGWRVIMAALLCCTMNLTGEWTPETMLWN